MNHVAKIIPQSCTYKQEEDNKLNLLEMIRGYTFLQLKSTDNVEKWLQLQKEIENLEFKVQAIQDRKHTENKRYKNIFSKHKNLKDAI